MFSHIVQYTCGNESMLSPELVARTGLNLGPSFCDRAKKMDPKIKGKAGSGPSDETVAQTGIVLFPNGTLFYVCTMRNNHSALHKNGQLSAIRDVETGNVHCLDVW
jgi:hypothetical protein